MIYQVKGFFIALLASTLLACGGGGGGGFAGGGGGGGGAPPPATVRIGNGTGATFVQGMLAVGLSSLSAGGITSVTANLVDSSGNPIATATDVSFSSNCVASGLASLVSPVTAANGLAVSTYTALGCSGNDVITATATVGGVVLTATVTVNVLPATVGSLQFVSATPLNITISGVGGAGRSETSTVIFRVRDVTGVPVAGQQVSFSLNTSVGGITLTPATATSLADGTVQTIVRSGTQQTPVRVTATIVGVNPSISTQSDQLSVSSGIPDQNSFSISAVTLNPEAFDIDGVIVPITIAVSDHFNTPVPDQTAVSFTTEGARIAPASCLTMNGSCSVNWISSNPRPADGRVTIRATAIGEEGFVDSSGNGRLDTNAEAFADINGNGFFDLGELPVDLNTDGTIGAGEFIDLNANAVFDRGEPPRDGNFNGSFDPILEFVDLNGNSQFDPLDEPFDDRDANGQLNPERFADISEAFTDNDEDSVRDLTEEFLDFNGNSLFDGRDGRYNGILCTDQAEVAGAICDAPRTLSIVEDIVLVMADSNASIEVDSGPLFNFFANDFDTIAVLPQCSNFALFTPPSRTFRVRVRGGDNGQIMPAGTTIAFSSTNGTVTSPSPASITVPNTTNPAPIIFVTVRSDATQVENPQPLQPGQTPFTCTNTIASGSVTIRVTTPGGLTTTASRGVTD